MGFFDFLFGKSKDENATLQTLSPIEQVVKESVEHLKKCLGSLTSEKLEAEAINLASFIFLRKGGKIDFELDFPAGEAEPVDAFGIVLVGGARVLFQDGNEGVPFFKF